MRHTDRNKSVRPQESEASGASLAFEMADTTWRMFIPTIGLLLIGRYFDGKTGTKPWLMLLGATIGSLIAWRLIALQLNKSNRN